MAARINTKFIFVLLVTLIMGGSVIGGLLFLQMRGDAGRQARLGDELMQQSQYEAAARHYGRAVRRDPGNLAYLQSFEKAVREIRPETGDAARNEYGRLLSAIRQQAQYNPSDPEAHLRLLREMHSNARLMSIVAPAPARRSQWEQLASAAEDMVSALPPSEPKQAYGKLYRGMAGIRLRSTASEAELDRAVQDVLDFLEQYPDEDLGWATLANGRQLIAEHMRNTASARRAAESRELVPEAVRQAMEAVPNGPHVNLVYVQYLANQRQNDPSSVSEQELNTAARRAIELVSQSNDPWLVLEAAQVARIVGEEEGIDLAIEMYNSFIAENPTAIAHKFLLAQLYLQAGQLDEATEINEAIIEADPLRVSFVSQMQLTLRRLAAGTLVDVEHRRYLLAESEGEQPDIESVRQARDRLATFVIDPENDPQLLRADGKLAMLEGEFEQASAAFERLIRDGAADAESYMYSAFCLERIGQIGLAHERTVAALGLRESNPFLLFRKARLEYRMGRYEEASQTINLYRELQPEDQQGVTLARAIEAAQSGETLEIDDPVQLALNDAQQALNEGQAETAMATIQNAMTEQGDDPRLFNAAARIAMSSGQSEQALQYVERALELSPDSRQLRQLRATLQTGNVVEAALQYVEAEYEDERERAAMMVVTLAGIAQENRNAIERLEGDQESADEARQIVELAEAELSSRLEQAIRLAPDDHRLIEYRFSQALQAEQWSEAETLANRARDLNIDQCRGLIYRGRLEMQRGEFDQAARAFQQASDIIPYSSLPWRGLAVSFQRLGNFREAQRAFEQAYRLNPNDMANVRGYLALLIQVGEHGRAARIARTAHRLVPGDSELQNTWLELEGEIGNIAVVLPERRALYEADPENRGNAARLAITLVRSEPTVDLLLDEEGNRRYSDRRWGQFSVSEQRRMLEELRRRWHNEADEIVQAIRDREGTDLELATLEATILRARGDVAAGERVLRDYIDGVSEVNARQLLTLAQFQSDTGQFNRAYETFGRALQYQSDERREVDQAIGNFLFERNAYEQAVRHFERVQDVNPQYAIELRIAEAYLNLGRLELADQWLQTAMDGRPVDFVGSMIQAMIAHRLSIELESQGRSAEAESRLAEFRQALDTAERLMPSDPTPHVTRARVLLADYRRTENRSLLNDALSALDRADAVRSNHRQTNLMRIDVMRAMGNSRGAIAEATRLVDGSPENIQFRQLLVQLHVEQGNHSAAVDTINQAIERYPSMALWYEVLGNVQANAGRMTEATAAFHRAYELGESISNLVRYVGTIMAAESPDYAAVLNMLRTVPEHVQSQPVLGASYGMALHKLGRVEAAQQHLRASYDRQREIIASGSADPGEIGRWYQIVFPILVSLAPAEAERKIREISGDDPDAFDLLWMSRRWAQAGQDGLSRAAELLSQAIDATPSEADRMRFTLRVELANQYLQAERYDLAATNYERAIRTDPDHALSLNNLAFIYAEHLDKPSEAIGFAERALALAPNEPSILDTIGWVHFKLGNHTQAEEYLRRSLALQETATTQLHLAHVLAAIGESEGAITRLRRASELRPDSQTQAEIDRLTDDIRTQRTQSR